MPTFTVYASGSTGISQTHPNTNYSDLQSYTFFEEPFVTGAAVASKAHDGVLICFADPGQGLRYKRVTQIDIHITTYVATNGQRDWVGWDLPETFDPESATYNDRPNPNGGISRYSYGGSVQAGVQESSDYCTNKNGMKRIARNGVLIIAEKWTGRPITIYGAKSDYKPYLVYTYSDDDVGVIATEMAPTDGAFVDKAKSNAFTWGTAEDLLDNQISYADVKQASAVLEWRVSAGTTVNSISVTGAEGKCTIPANTLPSGNIEWRVKLTANSGVETTSAWQSITTVDATPTAKPVSPSGVVIDATISNRFSWQHIISTGSAQSKADLQWSADGETWNTLATATGANQYYDVPANTFTSGTKYWRVRTYNTDGTASEWSAKAEFIAINAPSVPSISAQSTGPRPQIAWNTTEQEAYQVTLSNGYASGTVYGTTKAWRSPVYLADGTYTVRVRVQNQYGMWSDWGSAALPVSHTEGPAIALEASASHEAALAWQTAGGYDFYLIERDGIAIAKTEQKQYVDHTSIGSVVYRVRGCYTSSDNYGLSAAKSVEVVPETNMLCDLESGAWLEMRLSESQARTNRASFSAGVAAVHLAGLAYPIEERSGQRDRTIAVVCAWPHAQRAEALVLESLVSRKVCIKDRYGNMAIGTLSSLESSCDGFMRRYSFSIAHTNQEEGVSLDT